MQTFAPGVTVVDHSYRPVIGARFIVPKNAGTIEASGRGDPMRDFCIDGPTNKAIRELAAQKLRSRPDDGLLSGYTLAYILQTARNWRGPISIPPHADGRANRRQSRREPRDVALHRPAAVRTSPQRVEATVRDYVPKEDLRVLFISE